ncbi:hypothetical protein E8D34_18710 [Nocardioides sp. GY 10113]|uniref:hypothetical protein n=1 Tax=Nocardioides sp. GY 10113 TaxID=2569761 RepID=UPI0010A8B475|nr:hypothetical protein [Nocardioides sp. GY 10113]TIC80681.1 hypothetical protein E8D34_18710 [Nocardioides sp. GY 10113]
MRRAPRENVATVLVDPAVLPGLELAMMEVDLRVWPVATAPIAVDGRRQAFQIRRRLVEQHRGAWDRAAGWVPVWVTFGERWRCGDEPLPWAAHQALWTLLAEYDGHVLFRKRLGAIAPLPVPEERRRAG